MLTLEEARTAILERVVRATVTETVPLIKARARFCAVAVPAGVDNPAFRNSAMDGYAARVADLAARDFRVPMAGESSAGARPGELAPGTCMRIFTGAPLPAGADAVAIQEDAQRDGDVVQFPADITVGANVRERGEDFRGGDVLYPAGHRVRACDVALLATAGVATVPVYRRARVLVVATGDELVVPGQPLAAGQIYESNRVATLVQLEQLGVDAIDGGVVRDDPAQLRALLQGSREYDFVITSGGASVGDHDVVKQVFAEIGEIQFWKVSIKPGKPVAFGRIGAHTHFFALPGNPVSSLVTYKLFVEPALYAWHHASFVERILPAMATNGFRRRAGRTEFLRARLFSDNGRFMAQTLSGQGSHMLGPMRYANGFIRVEADSEGHAAGETVTAMPFD